MSLLCATLVLSVFAIASFSTFASTSDFSYEVLADGTAKFTSKNSKIAKVSANGKITAKSKGNTVVTVKTNGITLKCKVIVK